MHIIDSHFHWWPRSVFEALCKRKDYPRAERNGAAATTTGAGTASGAHLNSWAEWFDLDKQFEHMDGLGHQVDVVCSIGPFSVCLLGHAAERGPRRRDDVERGDGGRAAQISGPLWASAAVPLQDTKIAIEVLDHAVNKLGLMGVNLPGSVGSDPRIDAERLEPFYARVAELGVPLFLHPTDAVFQDMLDGYDGALHLSLGRVIEVSVAAIAARALRHDGAASGAKIVMSHTGGALPYQSGRMDKNTEGREAAATRQHLHEAHVHRHGVAARAGMKFAIEYYGIDHVMYGTDYPCWDPGDGAASCIDEIGLSQDRPAEALLRQRPPHPRPARPGAAAEPDVRTRTRSCLSGSVFRLKANPGASCLSALPQGREQLRQENLELALKRPRWINDDEPAGAQPLRVLRDGQADLGAKDFGDLQWRSWAARASGARMSFRGHHSK